MTEVVQRIAAVIPSSAQPERSYLGTILNLPSSTLELIFRGLPFRQLLALILE
jgi:hypothetical protein